MELKNLHQSFKNYILHERGMQPKTYQSVIGSLSMLCKFAETEELKRLNTDMVREFLHNGRKVRLWKAKTFRNHWQYLKIFFDWCLKQKYIKKNPLEEIEKPKLEQRLPRCLSEAQTKKVLYHTAWHAWSSELSKCRNEAILHTFLKTGLRHQELLNLTTYDVDLVNETITVRKGKNSKDRIVPIHSNLLPALKAYQRQKTKSGVPSQWFFSSLKSPFQLSQKDVRNTFEKIKISSGVHFTAHMLRHTFAKMMVEANLNIFKLQKIMGHAQIATTEIYMSVAPKNLKDSFNKVSFPL